MKSKQLLFLLIALSGLTACSSNDRRFRVIGNIAGLPEQTVILEQLSANDQITIVDSEKSKSDGHFELSGVAPEPGLYRLHFQQNKFICTLIELFFTDHSILNKDADVIPFLFKFRTILLEHVLKFIRYFFSNVLTDFFDVGITLQVAS